MKTQIFTHTFLLLLLATSVSAQDVTTVTAKNSDISDNLDLRAVASIFGDSRDLADFEERLNNPKDQISNLDLNGDGRVDYLRVIESVEVNTHLIILQAVLEKEVFQDVATLEVEKDSNNQVQVQVVGNSYIYGQNYIYEPVYVHTPIIYTNFWVGSYNPYYSPWYWNYYPTYYTYWSPYPIFRYRRHIHTHINTHHHYNYVTNRRSNRAVALYAGRRANGYERINPNRSFTQRNNNVVNRYELDRTRRDSNLSTRNGSYSGATNSSNLATGGVKGIRNTNRNTNIVKESSTPVVRNTGRNPNSVNVPSTPTTRNVKVRTSENNVPQVISPTRQTTVRQTPSVQTPTRTQVPQVTRTERPQTVAPSQPSPPRNNTVRRTETPAPTVNRQPQGSGTSPQREAPRRNTRG